MSEDAVLIETKRPSIWNGQELSDEFWAGVEPSPKRELPEEPAKVLKFPER